MGFFGVAAWALYDMGFGMLTAIFGSAVVLHYLLSYDRLTWLVRQ